MVIPFRASLLLSNSTEPTRIDPADVALALLARRSSWPDYNCGRC